ncbi:MAG: YdeI/OmpD-associated family protein [Bacteroidota bacterium]
MQKPIVNKEFLLQKVPGKGGWTYALIPDISFDQKRQSLWVKVKGTIDDHEFNNLNLAKIKGGGFFFPVKAEIRKAINKREGDSVRIVLFEDFTAFEIPEEFIECLKIEQKAYEKFIALKETHQKEFIHWIYEAKKEETRAERINSTINKVLKGERLYSKME